MTDGTSLSKLATDELASREVEPTAPTTEVRARALEAMLHAFREQRAAVRRRRVGGVAIAIAAAAAVVVFVIARPHPQKTAISTPPSPTVDVELTDHSGNVTVLHGDRPATLASSTPIAVDDRVHVGDGSASIQLSTGTQVSLESQTDVTFSIGAPNQIVTLSGGAATFHVAKLSGGDRFLVRTSDAEVEVRGTRFRVAKVEGDAACGGGTTTRVTVLEGIVVVRDGKGSSDVPAGEEWPKGCATMGAAVAMPAPTAGNDKASATATASVPTPTATATATTGVAPSTSALAEQNDLFTRALQEKKQGNAAAAVADLDALLAKYPGGPLSENAEVERMRLLHGAAAVSAAKAYLAHHPQGYAHAEAEAIVASDAP